MVSIFSFLLFRAFFKLEMKIELDVLQNYQTDYMVEQNATIDLFFSFSVPTFVTAVMICYIERNHINTVLLSLQSF